MSINKTAYYIVHDFTVTGFLLSSSLILMLKHVWNISDVD